MDGKAKEEQFGDGIEEADTDGKPILRSFVRYPLSENAAFRDDGVLVPAAGTCSIHDAVWICCRPYAATTNFPFRLYSYFLLASTTVSLEASERSPTPLVSHQPLSDGSRLPVSTKVHLRCSNRLYDITTLSVQSFTISLFDT